jgi:hypothetical protein
MFCFLDCKSRVVCASGQQESLTGLIIPHPRGFCVPVRNSLDDILPLGCIPNSVSRVSKGLNDREMALNLLEGYQS